jgi:serine/threonine protein kinase
MKQKPTDKSDIFAVGIILHQMLTNKHPFGSEAVEIIDGIRDHQPKPLP